MLRYLKKQEKLFKNVFQNSYHLLLVSKKNKLNKHPYRACEKCRTDKRKTINGDDLLFALNQLGFDRYLDNL